MAKLLLLPSLFLLLLTSTTTVLTQHLHTFPPPTISPANAPQHHHHHHHPPAPAPSLPPHHHYPPATAPVHPPTHHHHHHPPSSSAKPPTAHHHPPAPVLVPVKPPPVVVPVHPPVHPPVQAPAPVYHYPRSFVAVQGVVYVKSCHYAGLDTLLGATPLLGGVVKLQCNNTRYKLVETAKTDKNGYFYIEAPNSITSFGAHKCSVVLVSAPTGLKPSNFHGGVTGSTLRPEKPFVSKKLPFVLYTVGPLAFEPKCPH